MAANINSFASLKVPAWHGLGTIIEKPVGAIEFQEISGLNWQVSDSPIYTAGMIEIPNKKAIIRNDTGIPLGVVGSDYVSIQNEVLFQTLKELGEFDTELVVETAGALGEGETVWALAKMPSLSLKMGEDVVDPYILLVNGHVGNQTMKMMPTTIRVVCQNTLRMALKNSNNLSSGWSIKHSSNAMDRMLIAKNSLKEVCLEWENTKKKIDILASTPMTDTTINELISGTFGESKSKSSRGDTLNDNRNNRIFEISKSDTCNVSGTAGTLWAAFNAVTEYLDHDSILRSENKAEARFQNNLIDGPSVKYKENAWETVLEMV